MNKFSTFLEVLDEQELSMFEKDMKDGYIQKYVDRKKEYFKLKDKSCAVCGNIVSEGCFVLIFGEPSIRKKGHFCGPDCLEYFLNNTIRKIKKVKPKQKEYAQ